MRPIKQYSSCQPIEIFYWFSRDYTHPKYEFVFTENYYEHGRMISYDESKRRYDESFALKVSNYENFGYVQFLQYIAVNFSDKESAKKQIEDLKNSDNFHEYYFEIDWEH
jgi:hypothetical protein